jgi:hypothetical protein
VHIACSADGYPPCLEDESGGEQLQWVGWRMWRGRSVDAEFDADVQMFFSGFYNLELTDAQWRTLLASS